jgi:DNA-binding NtrC family response regulator
MDETRSRVESAGLPGSVPVPIVYLLYTGAHGVVSSPPLALPEGTLPLGRATPRDELASLRDDGSVSRTHALLERTGDAVVLADADSRNGTSRNGVSITRCQLSDGDVIRVGDSLLLLRHEPIDPADVSIPRLRGRSAAMRRLRTLIDRVAATPATVLLLGESGVGKGLAARELHERSGRRGAFFSVNCSAIPEGLAESQLFGHAAGAFTGARDSHLGFFRAAHQGTLFLDEIADLPATVQAKLLGAIEDRVVTPVGSVEPVRCDVRILAATNQDLRRQVETRSFRGDLYARVSEIAIELAPLRTRREDILLLFEAALGEPTPRLSPQLAEALLLYGWPYNVRELEKVASELKIRSPDARSLHLEPIAERLRAAPGEDAAEPGGPIPSREELLRLLRTHHGVVAKLARAAGRSRKQVYRWLEHHGLDPKQFRD